MSYLETMDTAELEEVIIAVSKRHGFVIPDYSLTWDRGQFDPARTVHEVTIVAAEGTRATTNITHAILANGDPWKHIGDIDETFQVVGASRGRSEGMTRWIGGALVDENTVPARHVCVAGLV